MATLNMMALVKESKDEKDSKLSIFKSIADQHGLKIEKENADSIRFSIKDDFTGVLGFEVAFIQSHKNFEDGNKSLQVGFNKFLYIIEGETVESPICPIGAYLNNYYKINTYLLGSECKATIKTDEELRQEIEKFTIVLVVESGKIKDVLSN